MATHGEDKSLPAVFTTKTVYSLPTQKFMIPATWKRYQLSQLVNKALALDKPVPFDFLVHGEILRASLGDWCAERGLGEEETLQIEYIESVMPPQCISSLPHEDWVAAVSCGIPGHFLTAGYDGIIRAFDYSQKPALSGTVHNGPITSLAVVGKTAEDGSSMLLTGSHDMTAKLVRAVLPSTGDVSATLVPLAALHLHTAPVSSVAASESGERLLTSSWDMLIGVWDASIPTHDEVPMPDGGAERKKRRKVAREEPVQRKGPLAVLKSHTARVSRAVFGASGTSAYSCGLDSTVRMWDVENGVCTNTITSSEKPMVDMTLTSSGNTVLAASTDRSVTLFDVRSAGAATSVAVGALSHPATPSCVRVSPTHENQVATGAFDGVVRVWDVRSPKAAVASFKAQEAKKVLALDWHSGLIAVGGEGGLDVWKFADNAVV